MLPRMDGRGTSKVILVIILLLCKTKKKMEKESSTEAYEGLARHSEQL